MNVKETRFHNLGKQKSESLPQEHICEMAQSKSLNPKKGAEKKLVQEVEN